MEREDIGWLACWASHLQASQWELQTTQKSRHTPSEALVSLFTARATSFKWKWLFLTLVTRCVSKKGEAFWRLIERLWSLTDVTVPRSSVAISGWGLCHPLPHPIITKTWHSRLDDLHSTGKINAKSPLKVYGVVTETFCGDSNPMITRTLFSSNGICYYEK